MTRVWILLPQKSMRLGLSSSWCKSGSSKCFPSSYTEEANLNYSGIDFDDPEYGFKEEDKAPLKVRVLPL